MPVKSQPTSLYKEKTAERKARSRRGNTLYIVLTAQFTALTFIAAFFINIPAAAIFGAGGNINLGDAVIFISALFLGPVGGAVSGAVGAAAADLASGAYIFYAPFTFVIKGCAGFICGFLYRRSYLKRHDVLRRVTAVLAAAAVITAGYFLTELIVTGAGLYASEDILMIAAVKTLPPNLLQTGLSAAAALILAPKIFPVYFKRRRQKDSF